ncbi:MAG: response regulator, partial [Myxococcales bacterium]|nr:response regulator [Myxococcales bacterium]
MTVLVIDDERSNRAILRAALGAWGCTVEAFERADGAIQAAPRVAPDLVLLDWRLPGLAGADAVRALRACTDAPIV